jgi:branched-chain amino acid transport system substrate-binding protein
MKTSMKFLCASLMFAIATGARAEVVKIGVAGPLTGAQAVFGKDNERGVRMAIDELNASKLSIHGQAVTFELISEDDQADPKTGMSVAQKLVDSGVKAVIGHYNSGVMIPADRIYDAAHIPVITGAASNPAITAAGLPYVFRLAANDNVMGARMAEFAKKNLGATKVAVIDDRTAYGSGVADVFVATAKKLGLEITTREFATDKSVDFTAVLNRIKATKPDAVFYGGYYAQASAVGRQSRQLALNVPILGGDGICSVELPKLAGGTLDGRGYCAQGGLPLEQLANGPAFAARYMKEFGNKADIYSPAFYSATMLVADAMKRANSTNPEKFVPLLKKDSFSTLLGTVRFDSSGEWVDAPVTLYKIADGKLNQIPQ